MGWIKTLGAVGMGVKVVCMPEEYEIEGQDGRMLWTEHSPPPNLQVEAHTFTVTVYTDRPFREIIKVN